ncbi:hypothetical protein KBZ07_15155 [Cyanobium sp. BA20m-14]|uniref:hypothetical protein n=1 Tax=Cyanobium sp. BA20m-14 TaxID=2823703 RepID=UPI0020CD4E96|nr:hypothetical protein [Cyanobium sp. BA20m-14]MCP9914715.1 hypothetical protein [Cyanobium sp. BA20m-14]
MSAAVPGETQVAAAEAAAKSTQQPAAGCQQQTAAPITAPAPAHHRRAPGLEAMPQEGIHWPLLDTTWAGRSAEDLTAAHRRAAIEHDQHGILPGSPYWEGT